MQANQKSRKEFSAIVNTMDSSVGKDGNGYTKYRKQSSPKRFFDFLNKKFPKWVFANCYNSKREKILTVKPSTLQSDLSFLIQSLQ